MPTSKFRRLAEEITNLLTYEATRDLELEPMEVSGWAGAVQVQRLSGKKVAVVPILRAGIGMLPGVLDLIPSARVNIIGIYRNEATLEPVTYYRKLSHDVDARTAIIVDPMLATGNSLRATIDYLKTAGCHRIKVLCLVAAPEAWPIWSGTRRRWRSIPPPWTIISTRTATSCPAWATRAIGCSAPSKRFAVRAGRRRGTAGAAPVHMEASWTTTQVSPRRWSTSRVRPLWVAAAAAMVQRATTDTAWIRPGRASPSNDTSRPCTGRISKISNDRRPRAASSGYDCR